MLAHGFMVDESRFVTMIDFAFMQITLEMSIVNDGHEALQPFSSEIIRKAGLYSTSRCLLHHTTSPVQ